MIGLCFVSVLASHVADSSDILLDSKCSQVFMFLIILEFLSLRVPSFMQEYLKQDR